MTSHNLPSQQRSSTCSRMLNDLPSYCSASFTKYSPQSRLLSTRKIQVYISTSPERNVIPIVNDRDGLLVHFLAADCHRQQNGGAAHSSSAQPRPASPAEAAEGFDNAASSSATPDSDGPTQCKVPRLDEQLADQQQPSQTDAASSDSSSTLM